MPSKGRGFFTFVSTHRLHARMAAMLKAFEDADHPATRFDLVRAMYPEAARSREESRKADHKSERMVKSALRNNFIRRLSIKTVSTKPLNDESDRRRHKESMYVLEPDGERYVYMYDKYMSSLGRKAVPKLYERGPNYEANLRKVNRRRVLRSRRERGLD